MKNTLNYKGFLGSVTFSAEDNILHGKIECIDDLILYEGGSVSEIKNAFKEAVEDYIEICKQSNKPLMKSFKGSFNLHVTPDLHQKAAKFAATKGISLNQLVQNAIEREIAAT
jgi:predicted HicB family RNase H-like nuclease